VLNLNLAILLKKLRYGFISRIWPPFAHCLIKSLGPEFAAWLSSLSLDRDGKNGPQILCLSRESFVKDICELRKKTDFSYTMVIAGFTRFQMAWMPKPMQIQTFYQNYEGIGKEEATRKSQRYALRLITLAGKKRKVQAVLSANFDYWQDQGFKQACKILDIPFVVLSREHPVIPQICDIVADWYLKSCYRFDGAAIAVAGISTKALLKKVGTICLQEQIVITGLPRFDVWRGVDISKSLEQRSFITLLTFTQGYFADNTFKEVLRTFCEAARSHQDKPVRFLIKTKDLNDSITIKRLISKDIPSNLICDHDIDLFVALPESRLVINYNSLSLVEAAMARATIAIPAWGECKDRGSDVMYPIDNPKVARVANFVYSEQQLRDIIDVSIEKKFGIPISEAAYTQLVNEYVYIPSATTCSAEVAALLSRYILLANKDSEW